MTSCEHKRILEVYAKASDLQSYGVPHLKIEDHGYAPFIDNLCGGDDVSFNICLDCGVVVGFAPMSDDEVKRAFGKD